MKLFIDKIYAEYYTVRLKVWDKFDYLEKKHSIYFIEVRTDTLVQFKMNWLAPLCEQQ
jgi:hypothetical protein